MAAKRRGFIQKVFGYWLDPEETSGEPSKPISRDNELESLDFDGYEIRTIWVKGEQWWVAADVCGAIEIKDTRQAVETLDEDEKGRYLIPTLGGPQQMAIVNEPGLYNLLGKSNKPKAKKFWRWVRHDVLPAIRDKGYYSISQESADQTPIRTWVQKRASHHGFGKPWQKHRQRTADTNKAANAQTFAMGGNPALSSNRYNGLYQGLLGKPAQPLKAMVGCRDKDSVQDHMGDALLACYEAANTTLFLKMKDGLVTPDTLVVAAEEHGKIQREAAFKMLGPGWDFQAIEDQRGRKILEATRQLPG